MTLRTRLNKLEEHLCDPNPKRLVDREWFDAVVARVLRACDLGQNMGLSPLSDQEARVWAKEHIEQNVSFGGFGFDIGKLME